MKLFALSLILVISCLSSVAAANSHGKAPGFDSVGLDEVSRPLDGFSEISLVGGRRAHQQAPTQKGPTQKGQVQKSPVQAEGKPVTKKIVGFPVRAIKRVLHR